VLKGLSVSGFLLENNERSEYIFLYRPVGLLRNTEQSDNISLYTLVVIGK
jgi:hypothetical protein